MIFKLVLFISLTTLLSCSNDIKEVDALLGNNKLEVEIAKNVTILYSDSAVVRLQITAPEMHRYISKKNPKEEWPIGLHVDFFDLNKNASAWLDADYGVRLDKKDLIIVRKNVKLHNKKGDILESPELRWDQKKEMLYTEEFVRIIQVASADTIYGYGFETDKAFKKFKIKRKFSTKRNVELLGNFE